MAAEQFSEEWRVMFDPAGHPFCLCRMKAIFESEEKLNALGLSPTQDVFFKDKKNYNSVLNLQLLEETINKSKGDNSLLSWATSNRKSKIDLYVDDDISLDIKDFEAFISSRKKNLTAKLKIILNI